MEEQEYFRQALSDFTYEAACGGAIRHLADLGYTVGQIVEQLTFPVPYEKVWKTVWEYYLNTGILLLEEPGKGTVKEKAVYVKEYDRYGRSSFRRMADGGKKAPAVRFEEKHYNESIDGSFKDYFAKKCRENQGDGYVFLDFESEKENAGYSLKESLDILDSRRQDYLCGLLGKKKKAVYHRLNPLMEDILVALYENGRYQGACYFMKTEEKVIL